METFKIEHLSFTYPEESLPALSDINLSVKKGEFFLLCGHSGSGKSTLLRRLKPAIAPHGEAQGEIYFAGEPLEKLSAGEAAAKIGFVMQSPDSQTVTDKVWHELAFGLESLGADSETIRRRSAEMAAFFGLENLYYKNVAELSGGQKQLLCLASVMAMQPEVLLLDEPTAQLDPIAASEFLSVLGKINRETGVTVILSEHRLEEALPLAHRAAVMENGRILCCGSADEIGGFLKAGNYSMFAAMPSAMRIWGSVETDLRCPVTVNEGKEFLSEYLKTHKIKPLCKARTDKPQSQTRLKASGVWFRYEKELPDVVKELEITAFAGEHLCILGGNGSGKTTTLKLLAGIKKPYRGEIEVKGKTALLPQDPKTVFVKKSVYEDLADACGAQGIKKEDIKNEIAKTAALCEISGLLYRHPYDLSGGEQQRAALAKVLLFAPDILLLDEPTKGLDVPFKEKLAEILQRLKHRGVCIVTVSHDIEFCAKYADRCGMFFDGGLVTTGAPDEFFAGNSFYTTAAGRIAKEIEPRAITAEDVIAVIGGKLPEYMQNASESTEFSEQNTYKPKEKPAPLWRKIAAALCAIAAAGVYVYAAKAGGLSRFVDFGGITGLGKKQLALYGIFIALLILVAVFSGKKSNNLPEKTLNKRKISKRTAVAAALILLLIPLTLFIGVVCVEQKQYYITALAVLFECMIPFFLIFEGRKPKARELVIIAALCALGVAGRAAFFMLPQFKPVTAITIIAGVAFGGETGFLVGAVTMLVSNILFSQGPWTPWQMFAIGIIGFLAGLLYKKGLLARTRLSLCIFGAITVFVIYGGIMNPTSALIWSGESLNFKIILSYYITGFPMDAVHAASTAIFLWFGAEPLLEKLDRLKTKYGLVE